ncbi:MAG: chromate transporter [Firmicutes bacterium]|nr:chromate transporter [Bacillota bacterium]
MTSNGKALELWKMFIAFFKMGLFTIGGGLAMIPLMQKYAVDDQKWLTEEEMVDCIAISYSVPGVVAINAATFIGKKKYGMTGAVIATLGVTLPSLFCIIAIVLFLGQIENNKYVQGAFVGLTAAACGLIARAMVRLAKQSIKNVFGWIVAICAFAAITLFNVNAILVIVISAISGYAYMRLAPAEKAPEADAAEDGEEDGR